ncbi:MAG: hypothetical protein M3377_09225 [Actinomycetota bacterium]|nr:hypothetical protein [Actinomycetota bacterium]
MYVYTDSDCVNGVHSSDLVGSPAYVPRISGVLDLPASPDDLGDAPAMFLSDAADEGLVFDAGGDRVYAAGMNIFADPDRRTGLWDVDWPDSRYWWTVVPTVPVIAVSGGVEYHDVAIGEDTAARATCSPSGKRASP